MSHTFAAARTACVLVALQFAVSYLLGVYFNVDYSMGAEAPRPPAAERRGEACVLEVGDLRPVRDFSRVEDVARAYGLLLQRGVPGEAYNVGSGRGAPVRASLYR